MHSIFQTNIWIFVPWIEHVPKMTKNQSLDQMSMRFSEMNVESPKNVICDTQVFIYNVK